MNIEKFTSDVGTCFLQTAKTACAKTLRPGERNLYLKRKGKKGSVAKEKDNLLEGEGEDDCIWVLLGLLWLQYVKSVIVLPGGDNSGAKVLY